MSWDFLCRKSCHLWIESFIYLFPICMPLISFPCLTALAGTSSEMMNKTDETGHPCLILNFAGKAFSLSPLSMMLAIVFYRCPLFD